MNDVDSRNGGYRAEVSESITIPRGSSEGVKQNTCGDGVCELRRVFELVRDNKIAIVFVDATWR